MAAADSGADTHLLLDQPITDKDKVRGSAASGAKKFNNCDNPQSTDESATVEIIEDVDDGDDELTVRGSQMDRRNGAARNEDQTVSQVLTEGDLSVTQENIPELAIGLSHENIVVEDVL